MLSEAGREKVRDWGERRRNFSIFKCSGSDAEEIREVLGESVPDLTILCQSDLADVSETSGPVLLFNVSSEEAYKNANYLHRLIVRLIRWDSQPVFLLTPDSQDKWERGNLWLGDGKIDEDGLRLDALTLVLRQDSVFIPDMSILDLASDQPDMTYIEKEMAKALNAKGISFTAQALIGRYHVDFLVKRNGAQVVVECDGKAYHSSDEAKEKDKERDSYLLERGYRVLRFTGGEINSRAERCVEQIEQALDESQAGRSQGFRMDDNLDDSQKEAVSTPPGQVCVLAPAGSGKTKVLTNRSVHLTNEGFREHRVLALAFNKKAREEMQKRLLQMGFSDVKRHVHTFNSYGAQLLADRYTLKGKGFLANEDKQYAKKLFAVVEKHCGELRKIRGSTQSLEEAIQKVKRELGLPGRFLEPACRSLIKGKCPKETDRIWSYIFEDFLQWQKNDHLTFADQVYLAVRELAEDAGLRRKTQMSLDALLIDEFQDLDAAQSMLIEILALGHGNLFVVGDDDQMIYGWRGADIERLRRFFKDPYTHKVTLSTNYRSSQLVVRHAGFLISHNTDRVAKNVRSKAGTEIGKVELFIGEDIGKECSFLVRALNSAKKEGLEWKDLAVLVRYKELYPDVLEELNRADIPVDFEGAVRLYSTRAARAVAGYFAAVLDWPSPPKSVWSDIINAPNRYLSYEYVDQVCRAADPIEVLRLGKNTKVDSLLKKLAETNKAMLENPFKAHELFQRIDAVFGLTRYFKQEPGISDDNDAADGGFVVERLQKKSRDFSDPGAFLKYCREERDRENIEDNSVEQGNAEQKKGKNAVQLMTIHKAKGKEWKGVILFHQEWRKPSSFNKLSLKEKRRVEEEERRVVYVGATRAIESLWVTAERGNRSRFVEELFSDPEFSESNTSKELAYRHERLEKIGHEISGLQEERNQQQIAVDRAQGIDLDSAQEELDRRQRSMSLLKRLLSWMGMESTRVKQLKKDLKIAEEGLEAEQRIQEIDDRIAKIEGRKQAVLEEMDRLKREQKFRRILSYSMEEGVEVQEDPFLSHP